MTADVNAAAAAGCPHHHTDAKAKSADAVHENADKSESCGFNSQMMAAAQHAGGWSVSTDSATVDSRLSAARVVSSIPKSDYTPAHQQEAGGRWEYPSEEMYFKAMKRKGWDPEADQMKTIVAIHNTVNEQSWLEVMKWEAQHPYVLFCASCTCVVCLFVACLRASLTAAFLVCLLACLFVCRTQEAPKLKRFIGKPTEYSPKARAMNLLGWYGTLVMHSNLTLVSLC